MMNILGDQIFSVCSNCPLWKASNCEGYTIREASQMEVTSDTLKKACKDELAKEKINE